MKTLTPQQIVDLKPCEGYNLQQVTKLFDNKKSVTYLEILDTDKIPLADIVWVFCRSTVLDDDIRNQWLEVIITRAVTNCALHCGINTVEKWAKNWLSSVDRTAKAAGTAARAAYAAAGTAYNATYATAAAAGNTAYNAANAAHAAAGYAAGDGAYSTYGARNNEYKQQIQDLKDILQGELK